MDHEQNDRADVEAAAVSLLASREHSRAELCRKLGAKRVDPELVDSILDGLQKDRLQSDERFAENYVEKRSRKGFGPLRIRVELAERGVASELISRWVDEGPWDWGELLDEAAAQKFGTGPAGDMKALGKRGRFLEQRGFPISLIRRYLNRVRGF